MAGQSTTRLRASGHRFVLRRVERALLCGNARPVQDPLRPRLSLAVGCLLVVIGLAGCALMALVRPQPVFSGAPIILGRPSGALYVRVDETLHPVLNLASARLIAATDADPQPVPDSDLGRARRGPALGIPGAPQVLHPALPEAATWSVCDTAENAGRRTVVIIDGGHPGPVVHTVGPEQSLLVSVSVGGQAYLLYRGRRTPVNRPAPAVAGLAARQVSGLLLNAVPEALETEWPDRVEVLPESATLCVTWAGLAHGEPDITLTAGADLPLPSGRTPVALAQADGAGPLLDAVYLPPGHSAYVRPVGVSGSDGGERYLVADTGVRFTVGDDGAARSLGLPTVAMPAPWPVLAGLPAGPPLSQPHALIARDVVPAGG